MEKVKERRTMTVKGKPYDPILVEVIRGAFDSIRDEMAEVMMLTSGSPAQTEAMDYCTGITDAKGEAISIAPLITVHQPAEESYVKYTLRRYPPEEIEPGDCFLMSDPREGGCMHINDHVIVKPIFVNDEIAFWAVTEGHLIDVGGLCPGSWSVGVYDCYGEGIRLPPVKIMSKGKWNRELVDFLQMLTRTPALYMGDLRAFVASNNRCEERLRALIDRYGLDTLKYYCEVMKDLSEVAMREKIKRIPNGRYYNVDWQQHNGLWDGSWKVAVELIVKDDEMIIDLTKSDPQTEGFINGTWDDVRGFCWGILVLTLGYDIPVNSGAFRPFKFITKKGTIVDSLPPAGNTSAHMDSGVRVARAFQRALYYAMLCSDDPEIRSRASGCWCEVWEAVTMMGIDQYKRPYVEVNMDGGMASCPAQSVTDGFPGCGGSCQPGNKLPDVEWNENKNPFLFLWKRIVPDTGGPGTFRAGNSIEYAWTPWKTDMLRGTLNCAIRELPARGVTGGYPGTGGRFTVYRQSNVMQLMEQGIAPSEDLLKGKREDLPGKLSLLTLKPGDVFIHRSNASGGMGDPLFREYSRIEDDYRRGLLSLETAKRAYGAVIDPSTGKVDIEASEKLRLKIRKERLARSKLEHPRFGKLKGYKKIRPITWYLDLVEKEGTMYIICNQCNEIICKKGQQWREFAAYCVREASEAMMETLNIWTQKRRNPPLTMMVEYFCPGCGVALSVEILTEDVISEIPLPVREEPDFLFT